MENIMMLGKMESNTKKIYMESETHVITKVLEENPVPVYGVVLKEKDEFTFRKNLLDDRSLYEIKVNNGMYVAFTSSEVTIKKLLEQYEFVSYIDFAMKKYDGEDQKTQQSYVGSYALVNKTLTTYKDEDVFGYYGDRMGFVLNKYTSNNSLAISVVYVSKDNHDEELYGTLTVNLEEYGIYNTTKQVVIHHDYMEHPQKNIVDKFIEMYGTGKVQPIQYGFAQSIVIEIDDFRKIPISPDMNYDDFE